MNEIKIWVNKAKESQITNEYENPGVINIDIKYKSNLSSNIRECWYRLGVKELPNIYEDLYIISLVIFAIDKRVSRNSFPDAWTRKFNVNIPVIEFEKWENAKNDLNSMLSYLSGDEWHVNFRECELDSNYKSGRKREPVRPEFLDSIKAVSLFSGGLDSFCGAHKLLSEKTPTLFVGFQEYGPLKGLQSQLIEGLQHAYPESKCDLLSFTAVARKLFFSDDYKVKAENTSRSRSFLFLCAALTIAEIAGEEIPVYIPENGFIGLNLPMTPGRLGSCSTRTTHPYYLKMFNSLLEKLRIKHKIINPYAFSTKREMVNQFKENRVFQEYFYKTISCSHPCNGRWERYPVPQNCGYCYPCLIRQSSLLDVDLKNEQYGEKNLFKKGFIKNTTDTKRSDLEDLLSAIITAKNSTDSQLRKRIAMTGDLSLEEINSFLNLYRKTMSDLEQMLSKSSDYKQLIGD